MPAGLPHQCRCSSTAARIITLAADGQDINEVLENIIDDIVKGAQHGIESYDTFGNKVRIFLDPIAIIGDYPAISSATDVSGHTADAFCSFCVNIKRKGGALPDILYSFNLHSRRLSY